MNKLLTFLKMEGLGNDFIVTHKVVPQSLPLVAQQVVKLCDRRRGIGADGCILLLPSKTADFRMRIWNSDGSEAEMCGNGIRCCAVYANTLKLSKKRSLTFETGAGIIATTLTKSGLIRVTMGRPRLDAPLIPTTKASGRIIMEDLCVDHRAFKITALSMGNPHAVIFENDLTDDLVQVWGKKIEPHSFFPKRTNVEFVKVCSENEIQVRVWERGCGETLACGTGACAAMVAGVINKKLGSSVTVHLPGGDLFVEWDGTESSPVYLTGPATVTFKGSVEISL